MWARAGVHTRARSRARVCVYLMTSIEIGGRLDGHGAPGSKSDNLTPVGVVEILRRPSWKPTA